MRKVLFLALMAICSTDVLAQKNDSTSFVKNDTLALAIVRENFSIKGKSLLTKTTFDSIDCRGKSLLLYDNINCLERNRNNVSVSIPVKKVSKTPNSTIFTDIMQRIFFK